ncbi:malonic semialdehyde reductase [Actinocatenispora rupis]|uniref:Putative NADH dehydrogenase/NAD(P)H nitroreductase n=1 Tax=Actinocatenispora rupis TaxID=519421 RepID=A0A8J3JGA0_9ACTN|nr:malonic semialdehyde reductase [Actinocatenispora rupis]GID15837.1 putative NADH dehydrogenase/NAD(P)H nitroreductase [Actinocatenispora rupis]
MTVTAQTGQNTPLALDEGAQDLLFRNARTANTFTDEPVTDEQIQAIHDLVKWGPTSMNQQPLRVVLVRTPEARQRLVAHMSDNNKDKTGKAPLVAILAADTDFHEEMPRVFPHFPGAKDMFAANDELREGNARLNGALQIAYFILGVRAAGLAAGPMTGFDAAGIDAEFFPDGKHRTQVVVNIGKPGDGAWFDRLPRLSYDEVFRTV